MPSLNFHGEVFDLPPDAFLTGIVGIFLSPFDEIKHIFWTQQIGQIKMVRKEEYSTLESCLLLIRDNLNVIEDEKILKFGRRIDEAIASFVEFSKELIVWENSNVTSYARRKHRHLTLDVGTFEVSPWVSHPDYQVKLKLITKSVSLYHETLVKLVSHIEPMIISSNSESLLSQITRFKQQIPDYRLILQVGFQEYLRIKASKLLQ